MTDPVESAAEELYGVVPADFVTRRTALAAALRADGDKAGAKAVAALRRPTVSAWLANLIVREHREEVEQLLTLGDQLRTAQETLAGDALRQLGAQRRAVVGALVQAARRLAVGAGSPATSAAAVELASTLEAALADPQAAEAVRSGRLLQPLSHAGFGPVASVPAPAPDRGTGRSAAAKPTSPPRGNAKRERADRERVQQRTAQIAAAERTAREAAAAADDAQQAHERAQREEQGAVETLAGAQSAAAALEAQLAVAQSAVTNAEGARQRAAAALVNSERDARQRHDAAGRARTALDRLRRR